MANNVHKYRKTSNHFIWVFLVVGISKLLSHKLVTNVLSIFQFAINSVPIIIMIVRLVLLKLFLAIFFQYILCIVYVYLSTKWHQKPVAFEWFAMHLIQSTFIRDMFRFLIYSTLYTHKWQKNGFNWVNWILISPKIYISYIRLERNLRPYFMYGRWKKIDI